MNALLPIFNNNWLRHREPAVSLFDSFFSDFELPSLSSREEVWAPAIDVSETENEYTVKAEMPGMKKDDIDKRIAAIAREISSEYQDQELVLIGILKGAFVFMSDLMRALTIPVRVDFLRAASYGSGTSSSGNIRVTKEPELDLKDKHVLLIEDIIDSGLTIAYLIDYLKSFGPKTVKVCALVDKQERRTTTVKADYVCHIVEKGFLVG